MKKITFILYITIIVSQFGFSQERKVLKAEKKYDSYAFIRAIDIYEQVANKGYKSAEIFKKLGNAYYFNANYDNAAKWYGELVKLNDKETEAEYFFRYAQSLKAIKQYKEADKVMKQFYDAKKSDNRAQLFESQPEYLEVIKFQSGRYEVAPFPLNSNYSDFAPSFYQKSLVFSSSRDTGIFTRYKHTWNEQPFLDLYGTSLDQSSKGATKFSKQLNTKYHESTTTFTKDGNTVYFTRSNYTKGKYKKDTKGVNKLKIYKATINSDGEWQNISELPFNSDEFSTAHPALSPDEKKLYFASDRDGSMGQSDIYVVAINSDGSYGVPENLGASVNTEGRETFPFVSTEGNLYFSSDGHPGLGGLDVFVIKTVETSAKVFNVGEPINSPDDDFTFIIDDTTKEGYFASNRDGGKGSDDIYVLKETIPVKDTCNKTVAGTVKDKETLEAIEQAEVLIIDENNKVVETSFTDANGTYALSLDCIKDNFVRVQKKGYVTTESLVEASFNDEKLSLNFEMERDTVTAGIGDDLAKILDLKPIYFDLNKSRIRKDAEIELAKVIAAMEKYPSLKIDVRSHTDSRANDDYNLRLSERRAKSTIAYLVKNGIDASRITGKGYGESQLVNECGNGVKCSKENHELNRRSEFVILQ